MIALRTATTRDAAGLRAIYAPYIETTAFTFENEVPSVEEIAARIEKGSRSYPWLVCTDGETVAGYVYASLHRDREAYQWTSECSIYIHPKYHGKGLALIMYSILFQIMRMQGLKTVYAGITLPNEASVRLHEKCGFEHFATYDNVGYKMGKWHKVGWWKLQLGDYELNPPPPLLFSAMDPQLYTPLLERGAAAIAAKIKG